MVRAQAEAVTLFVERARGEFFNPGLALDNEAGAVVARLVQRLDGMPLAIELAAARVEALGLGQMLDRLDNRADHANRAARPAAVARTPAVDLELPAPRPHPSSALPGLSVFLARSAWMPPSVAGSDAGPRSCAVDCCCWHRRGRPEGGPRSWMLENLRGYGLRQLGQAGEVRGRRRADGIRPSSGGTGRRPARPQTRSCPRRAG